MTKTRSTKAALLSSVLALFLCVTMLLGTTFAWFTDSVTSANNIIKSGNLDVELYYMNDEVTTWTKVTNTTNVFKDGALWEPGHTEVVKLKVVNEGTLALKYQLGVNVASEVGSVNVDGKDFKLSNFIKFGIVDGEQNYTRDAAVAAVDATATKLSNIYSSAVTALEATKEKVVTMVVYMPTSVGNEANAKTGAATPTINLGINVFATQYTAEADSFDNQYDVDAPFSVWNGTVPTEMPASLVVDTAKYLISINDADAFAYFNTLINDANFYNNYGSKWKYSIELNADIDLANKEWTPITMANFVEFNGNGHVIKNLYVNAGENVGLFAAITCNDIGETFVKNFTLSNASVTGTKDVGAVVGKGMQAMISNVTVENATLIGTKYVGGIFGWGNGAVNNCTVKDSYVLIPDGGEKEAGGLIGYLSNDGNPSSVNKVISGNVVDNVTVSAPTVASALVSQPNSSNTGTAVIVIEHNTVKNSTVTTTDDTADIYVSNNVSEKSVVADNTETGCTVNKSGALPAVVDDVTELNAANKANATVIVAPGTYSEIPGLANGLTLVGSGDVVFEDTLSGTMNNTTIKNVTFSSGNAQRWAYSHGTLVFENCTFDASSVYAIHYDGLNSANITYKNCTIIGWAAIGSGAEHITFDGCTIIGNGSYGVIRLYSPGTIKNCTFDVADVNPTDVFQDGIHAVDCTVTVENCTNANGAIEDIFNVSGTGVINKK